MEKKDWFKVLSAIAALTALGLSIFNTLWQYEIYQERLHQPDYFISNIETVRLRGDVWDWKVNFTVLLKVVSPHFLRISVKKNESSFYVHNEAYDKLVHEYPLHVIVSEDIEEHVGQGVNTIQLSIPVEAKILIKGIYQAMYSSLVIGKPHFFIHLTDLQTNRAYTLEAESSARWN